VKLPPLSLYMHLPWCVKKCPYCDFNSHTAANGAPTDRYVRALLQDLATEAPHAKGRRIESVFMGGGTPSLFSPEEIAQLLDGVRANFDVVEDVEITMEANPGTVEYGSPAGYREAGVTRLSIGAQSFDDATLRSLGRIHTSDDIVRAVENIRAGGFTNFNIDLMHGLPEQTVDKSQADLAAAIALGPTHLSWYQLTLEPNTVFHARPPANLPNEELAFDIYERGQSLLAASGYRQYEISAYARDGRTCRHNLNYWSFGDYLAVGAGAHGKLTTDKGVFRYQKPANPQQYMLNEESGLVMAPLNAVPEHDLVFEFMLNSLRLNAGFHESMFVERTGLTRSALEKAATGALRKKLLMRTEDGVWRPTELGARFLNDLQAEFVPERRH